MVTEGFDSPPCYKLKQMNWLEHMTVNHGVVGSGPT